MYFSTYFILLKMQGKEMFLYKNKKRLNLFAKIIVALLVFWCLCNSKKTIFLLFFLLCVLALHNHLVGNQGNKFSVSWLFV